MDTGIPVREQAFRSRASTTSRVVRTGVHEWAGRRHDWPLYPPIRFLAAWASMRSSNEKLVGV